MKSKTLLTLVVDNFSCEEAELSTQLMLSSLYQVNCWVFASVLQFIAEWGCCSAACCAQRAQGARTFQRGSTDIPEYKDQNYVSSHGGRLETGGRVMYLQIENILSRLTRGRVINPWPLIWRVFTGKLKPRTQWVPFSQSDKFAKVFSDWCRMGGRKGDTRQYNNSQERPRWIYLLFSVIQCFLEARSEQVQ